MMHGFDMSFYQSDNTWLTMTAKADFVIHKVSEQTFRDPKGVGRLKALDPKKPAGAYHLIKPSKHKWEDEFNTFCGCIDEIRKSREIGIALDLESTAAYVPYNAPESYKIWICNLVNALFKKYNRPVIMYMGDLYPDNWYQAFKEAGAVFWIARWNCTEKSIKHDCHFWQYTSKYQGMNLDADKAMKSDNEILRVLCQGEVAAVPVVEHSEPAKPRVTDELIAQAINVLALAVLDGKYGVQPERGQRINKAIQERVNQLVKEGA